MPVLVKPCRAVHQYDQAIRPVLTKTDRIGFRFGLLHGNSCKTLNASRGSLVIPKAFLTYLKSFLGVFKEYIIK